MFEFDISPEKCLMIGDAKADIHAAKENNMFIRVDINTIKI